MSGTGIVYGDRPIATVQGNGAFATQEFYQYLQRLSASHGSNTGDLTALQAQVTANTTAITTIDGHITTLTVGLAASVASTNDKFSRLQPQFTELDLAGAVPLTSGVVAGVTSISLVSGGNNMLIGTLCLTGTGSVTVASVSVGITAGAIETASGAFGTGWFGAGAIPSVIGADLTIGSIARVLFFPVGTPVYLNVRATFSGAISAYGSLAVLPQPM
jgi:hypothetical protein